MDKVDPAHIAWCKRLMDGLHDGGAWAVPRSALAFQKKGDTLVLVGRMAHHAALPVTAEEWAEFQQNDYEATKRVFGEAGFTVSDATDGKQT